LTDDDDVLFFFWPSNSLRLSLRLSLAFRFLDDKSFSVRVSFESLSDVSSKSLSSVGESTSEGVEVGLLRVFFLFFVEEELSCPCSLEERFITLSFIPKLSEGERRKPKLWDVELVAIIVVAFFVPDPVLLDRDSNTGFNPVVVVFGVEERKFVEGEASRL